MFCVEVKSTVIYTANISDEEEKLVKEYIKNNPEKFSSSMGEDEIIKAVEELWEQDKIDLYKDAVESDFYTNDILWSEFERKTADEILNG